MLEKVAGSIFEPFIVILIGACHKFNAKMSERVATAAFRNTQTSNRVSNSRRQQEQNKRKQETSLVYVCLFPSDAFLSFTTF